MMLKWWSSTSGSNFLTVVLAKKSEDQIKKSGVACGNGQFGTLSQMGNVARSGNVSHLGNNLLDFCCSLLPDWETVSQMGSKV